MQLVSILAPLLLSQVAATNPSPATAPTAQPACYVGPIHVRVLNPDGTPAANVPLGIFGMSRYRPAADQPVQTSSRSRSDENGEHRRDSVRECAFPTFFYAIDESRSLAGFTLVDSPAELATPQTVRLAPARRVRFNIACPELARAGDTPSYFGAHLSPILDRSKRMRHLRYVSEAGGDFDYLVPHGEYRLCVQADRCQPIDEIIVRVEPGEGDIRLPVIELAISPLTRLTGQAAPPLHVAVWSDARPHTLHNYGGKPLILCFWQVHSMFDEMPELFQRFRTVSAAGIPFIAVHAPIENDYTTIAEVFQSWQKKVDDPGWSSDPRKWPFVNGIDERRPSYSGPEYASGRSMQPFGDRFPFPLFILIDSDGRIVANSRDSKPNFDAEFQRLTGSPASKVRAP